MKAIRALVAGLAVAAAGAATLVSAASDPNVNDVTVLNFALQLEYLESTFYNKGMAQFARQDFINQGISGSVHDYLLLIQAHENAHVSAIQTIIGGYGSSAGTASQACSAYSFSGSDFPSLTNFLTTAITLEGVGVSAYTGALNAFSSAANAQAAATIATVEARHTAYLRNNVGSLVDSATTVPFPNVTDIPFTPQQVVAAAGPFFTQCSYNFSNLPTVRPSGVTYASTGSASNPGFTGTSATPSSSLSYSAAQFQQDIDVLNYALTLEHLEADFYNYGLGKFSATQFNAASSGPGQSVYNNIALIGAHENAHVSALQSLIAARGQTAVTAGCYNWTSIQDVATYLTFARILENTGVSAYDGAANMLTDTSLLEIAATVATVEARHAAYLNQLTGLNATNDVGSTPNSFDTALSMDAIKAAITSVLVTPGYVSALTGGCTASGGSGSGSGSNSGSSSTGSSGTTVTSQIVNIVTTPNLDSFSASALESYARNVVIAQIATVYRGTTFQSVTGAANSARRLLAVGTVTTTASIPTTDSISTIINNIRSVVANYSSASLAPVSSSTGPNNDNTGAASTIGASIATLALAFASVLLL